MSTASQVASFQIVVQSLKNKKVCRAFPTYCPTTAQDTSSDSLVNHTVHFRVVSVSDDADSSGLADTHFFTLPPC